MKQHACFSFYCPTQIEEERSFAIFNKLLKDETFCKTAFYRRSIKRSLKFCLKFIFIGFVLSKDILTPTSWSQKAAQTERHIDCKKPSVSKFTRPREGRKVWRDRLIIFRHWMRSGQKTYFLKTKDMAKKLWYFEFWPIWLKIG